jgi:nicotinate-nucleotide--dimethylbenzimidazole phosphoribosyltransferase
MSDIEKVIKRIVPVSPENLTQARKHLDALTKPPGSLGRLEGLAGRYAAIKGLDSPQVRKKAVYVFAADHKRRCMYLQRIMELRNRGSAHFQQK